MIVQDGWYMDVCIRGPQNRRFPHNHVASGLVAGTPKLVSVSKPWLKEAIHGFKNVARGVVNCTDCYMAQRTKPDCRLMMDHNPWQRLHTPSLRVQYPDLKLQDSIHSGGLGTLCSVQLRLLPESCDWLRHTNAVVMNISILNKNATKVSTNLSMIPSGEDVLPSAVNLRGVTIMPIINPWLSTSNIH